MKRPAASAGLPGLLGSVTRRLAVCCRRSHGLFDEQGRRIKNFDVAGLVPDHPLGEPRGFCVSCLIRCGVKFDQRRDEVHVTVVKLQQICLDARPVGIATGGVLTLTIAAAPNTGSVCVRAVDEVSGAAFEQEVTADLPAANQVLSPRLFMNNGATAAAVAFDCSGVYLEIDY